MKKLLIGISLLLLSSTLFAKQWYRDVKVDYIKVDNPSYVEVRFIGASIGNSENVWIDVSIDTTNGTDSMCSAKINLLQNFFYNQDNTKLDLILLDGNSKGELGKVMTEHGLWLDSESVEFLIYK